MPCQAGRVGIGSRPSGARPELQLWPSHPTRGRRYASLCVLLPVWTRALSQAAHAWSYDHRMQACIGTIAPDEGASMTFAKHSLCTGLRPAQWPGRATGTARARAAWRLNCPWAGCRSAFQIRISARLCPLAWAWSCPPLRPPHPPWPSQQGAAVGQQGSGVVKRGAPSKPRELRGGLA